MSTSSGGRKDDLHLEASWEPLEYLVVTQFTSSRLRLTWLLVARVQCSVSCQSQGSGTPQSSLLCVGG